MKRRDQNRGAHEPPSPLGRADGLLILLLGLAVRVWLVIAFPGIHGGDSVTRLAQSDRLLLAYWLPLPQIIVFVARGLHPDPLWTRLAFAAIGSAVPVALARGVAVLDSAAAGRAAGILAALHPLLVYYSLVPYQEGPMLFLVLMGAVALHRGRERAASLWLGLACLTRYEAWLAAALAILSRRRQPVRALLLFGWAPLLWFAVWGGLSPAGTFVLDLDPEADRWSRLPFLFSKLREYSGAALFLLGLAGVAVILHRRDRRWLWPAAFVALTLAAIAVAGHDFPPGRGRVSERLAHVPAVALCALAGVAVGAALRARRAHLLLAPAVVAIAAAVGVGWTRRAHELVAAANRDPSLRLAVALADHAAGRLGPGQRLAVAAPPIPPDAVEAHARKIERMGGDPASARMAASPWRALSPDLNRIAAHLPRPPGTVIPVGAGPAALIAVFDDAPEAAGWARTRPAWRTTAGTRGVAVYEIRDTRAGERGPPLRPASPASGLPPRRAARTPSPGPARRRGRPPGGRPEHA